MFHNPFPIPIRFGQGGTIDIATGDFNGDHKPDILIINAADNLEVLLNDGNGSFAPSVSSPFSGYFDSWAIDDVNGDGKLDFAFSDGIHTVKVLLGNGDGTFGVEHPFTTVQPVHKVALADINGDHHLDLVVGADASVTGMIGVYFGDGTGQFSNSGVITNCNCDLTTLTVADHNGDGKLDITVGNVFLAGNGDGSFQPPVYLTAPPFTGTIADFDADGIADHLWCEEGGSVVSIQRGRNDGSFTESALFVSGPSAFKSIAADFDDDGKVDVVTLDYNLEIPALSLLRGNGDGTFQAPRSYRVGRTAPEPNFGQVRSLAVAADMNGDGKPDIVATPMHVNPPPFGELAVMINDGTGKMAAPLYTNLGQTAGGAFAIGDLNGDGKADAVVAGNPAEVLMGNGDGTFSAPVHLNFAVNNTPQLVDLDGDGKLDLFFDQGIPFIVYHGNGDGTFSAMSTVTFPIGVALFGDVNGDTYPDIVTNAGAGIVVALNDGHGAFSPHSPLPGFATDPVALADFNGDGKLDILSTGTSVRLGNGDGSFGAPIDFPVSPTPFGPVRTADFDRDGKMDVAFGTTVLFGDGSGRFSRYARFRTTWVTALDVADIDGNGSPDLVVTNSIADDVDILLTYGSPAPVAQPGLALTSDKPSPQYGEAVTITATMSGGTTPLTGAVTFSIDGIPVAMSILDPTGIATFRSGYRVGSFVVTATYSGDENYLSATNSLNLNVSKALTSISVSAFPNPARLHDGVRIVASMSYPVPSAVPGPSGSLILREGTTTLKTSSFSMNTIVSTLPLGTHTLTVDYAGDANYQASTASYEQVIIKPLLFMSISTSPSQPIAGTDVTVRASCTVNATGTISFWINGAAAGSAPIVQGIAEITATMKLGLNTVHVTYPGDGTYDSSTADQNITGYISQTGTPVIAAKGSAFLGQGDISVQWSQVVNATSYTIYRRTSIGSGWEAYKTFSGNTSGYSDTMPINTCWLMAITAQTPSGTTPMSAPDLVTSAQFSNVVAPGTAIKALDLTETRTAVNLVRAFANLPAVAFTNTVAPGERIAALDVMQLRSGLSEARAAIGLPLGFSDPQLAPGTSIIRAAHVLELRAGVD
ncbi:MAG TPA: FG-GAP-like repeat-containing protein [Thermoanaerobaculia bacterium]|nr:FG-GAP-like repeat-containing protein [Thermoanaerobaculia bacterium]